VCEYKHAESEAVYQQQPKDGVIEVRSIVSKYSYQSVAQLEDKVEMGDNSHSIQEQSLSHHNIQFPQREPHAQ
jgi:hypothetical protein